LDEELELELIELKAEPVEDLSKSAGCFNSTWRLLSNGCIFDGGGAFFIFCMVQSQLISASWSRKYLILESTNFSSSFSLSCDFSL
jgi:hypothetical protein